MVNNDEMVLNMYLKEINRIPLLTRDEEIELAKKAAAGDKRAREKIVNANLRFVVNVAKKYQNHGIDLVDLISEGNIGLLNAIEKFDADKGYHFISYAVWWIRQAILKAICEKSRAIRLPSNKVNELVQIEKAKKMVNGNQSEEEEIAQIGEMLNMENTYVREMLNISREMVSLDAQVSSVESSSSCVGDFIEDDRYAAPEEEAISSSLKDDIDSLLDTLKPTEAAVLRQRFGLNGEKACSLKEIGDKYNLTKERIRQIEKHAITRMRTPGRVEMLEAYVA